MRLPARLLVLPAVLTLALTGCSGDTGETPDEGTSPVGETASETPAEPYLDVPEGVELTAQGAVLSLGDTATVAWQPDQKKVGALEVKVTSMEQADFKQFVGWELTKKIKQTAPYFVRATVTNVGDTDLGSKKGALPVPLYGVDDQNRLIESSLFSGSFKPCQSAAFPDKFKPGATMKACMVYLAPDKAALEAVSFRPEQEFNPIIWEGEVVPADAGKKKDDKKKSDDKKDEKKKSDG
ncbi:hypothetical protein [Nocardioides aestuarii]|uniref:DUF4352 domain-containing protein n=1 Tax=Nocardioides aestuarii TaxID=252231 RepID=A0ABW4TST9_9ACTN